MRAYLRTEIDNADQDDDEKSVITADSKQKGKKILAVGGVMIRTR